MPALTADELRLLEKGTTRTVDDASWAALKHSMLMSDV